jgi:hypothetical protein
MYGHILVKLTVTKFHRKSVQRFSTNYIHTDRHGEDNGPNRVTSAETEMRKIICYTLACSRNETKVQTPISNHEEKGFLL